MEISGYRDIEVGTLAANSPSLTFERSGEAPWNRKNIVCVVIQPTRLPDTNKRRMSELKQDNLQNNPKPSTN